MRKGSRICQRDVGSAGPEEKERLRVPWGGWPRAARGTVRLPEASRIACPSRPQEAVDTGARGLDPTQKQPQEPAAATSARDPGSARPGFMRRLLDKKFIQVHTSVSHSVMSNSM